MRYALDLQSDTFTHVCSHVNVSLRWRVLAYWPLVHIGSYWFILGTWTRIIGDSLGTYHKSLDPRLYTGIIRSIWIYHVKPLIQPGLTLMAGVTLLKSRSSAGFPSVHMHQVLINRCRWHMQSIFKTCQDTSHQASWRVRLPFKWNSNQWISMAVISQNSTIFDFDKIHRFKIQIIEDMADAVGLQSLRFLICVSCRVD